MQTENGHLNPGMRLRIGRATSISATRRLATAAANDAAEAATCSSKRPAWKPSSPSFVVNAAATICPVWAPVPMCGVRHDRLGQGFSTAGSRVSATASLACGERIFITRMNADRSRQMLLVTINGHCPSMRP